MAKFLKEVLGVDDIPDPIPDPHPDPLPQPNIEEEKTAGRMRTKGIFQGTPYIDNPKPVIAGTITYHENRVIGLGSFHTVVYKGLS